MEVDCIMDIKMGMCVYDQHKQRFTTKMLIVIKDI